MSGRHCQAGTVYSVGIICTVLGGEGGKSSSISLVTESLYLLPKNYNGIMDGWTRLDLQAVLLIKIKKGVDFSWVWLILYYFDNA